MKQLYVAWTPYRRRPDSMQPFFGYELRFIAANDSRKWLKPLEYAANAWRTMFLFIRSRPDVLWVQVAPTFLLYIAFVYKRLFRRKMKIVADCRNSMYRRPWISLPGAVKMLNSTDRVLVHNHKVMMRAMQTGVAERRLSVLETRPAQLTKAAPERPLTSGETSNFNRPCVLFPCSFDSDEPIDQVLAAARFIPHIHFVVTGNPAKYKGEAKLNEWPANVTLAGFLPKSAYNELLQGCDIVMGLTIRDDVELSAANEAVGAVKPMVITGSALLKELFYCGAVYVDPLDPHSIADGCMEALDHYSELTSEIDRLRRERNERWVQQASGVIEDLL